MPRRSVRLQLSGYYNPDGTPTVCYKETRVRKWTYRRYDHTATRETSSGNSSSSSSSSSSGSNSGGNGDLLSYTLKHCFISVIFLALFYGFAIIIGPLTMELWISSHSSIYTVSVPEYKDVDREIQEVKDVLGVVLKKIDYIHPTADRMPNYALKSQGAKILSWMPLAIHPGQKEIVNWFGISVLRPTVTPNIVLQGRTRLLPGECWAFEGSQGQITVALSHRVLISHVSLGHLPKMLHPTGNSWSAPKEFSVYGLMEREKEWSPLGTYLYDEEGDALQTFELPSHRRAAFSYIKLHISSNWGHLEHTCLYDFRVHGKIAPEDDK